MSTAHCWFTGPAHLHLSSCRRQWASIQAPHFCFLCHSSHSHISESVSAQGKRSVASCALRINSEVCSMASRMPPDMAPVFLQSMFCLSLSLVPSLCQPPWLFSSFFWPWLWLDLEYLPLIILCLAAFLHFDFLSNVTSSDKCPHITPSSVFHDRDIYSSLFEIITCPHLLTYLSI